MCLVFLVFSVYVGYRRYVLITDLEMLKEVFVKQFNSLSNRGVRPSYFVSNVVNMYRCTAVVCEDMQSIMMTLVCSIVGTCGAVYSGEVEYVLCMRVSPNLCSNSFL